jgi:hypothetical protein
MKAMPPCCLSRRGLTGFVERIGTGLGNPLGPPGRTTPPAGGWRSLAEVLLPASFAGITAVDPRTVACDPRPGTRGVWRVSPLRISLVWERLLSSRPETQETNLMPEVQSLKSVEK